MLFFDERFNFVAEGSTQIRVATAGDNASPLAITNLKVPKNGFAYIYVSNESSTNVFFSAVAGVLIEAAVAGVITRNYVLNLYNVSRNLIVRIAIHRKQPMNKSILPAVEPSLLSPG